MSTPPDRIQGEGLDCFSFGVRRKASSVRHFTPGIQHAVSVLTHYP